MATEDSLFNINFVKSIENRPCIWNYTLSDYSKRTITEKAWKEVAEEVKDTLPNCRERWRNIRGSFLRSLKKPPSGSGTISKKKYYLADYLEFLLPYTKNKPSTGNLERLIDTNDNSEEGNSELQENTEFQDPPYQSQGDEIYQDTNVTNSLSDITTNQNAKETSKEVSVIRINTAKKRKVSQISPSASNPADDAFVEWLKNKQQKPDLQKQDPNMSFFHSLLPDVRKMTDKQNRRFRKKVIGLVDDILEDADLRPPSNLSWSTNITRSSTEPYVAACPTPSANISREWPVEEQRNEIMGRLEQDQSNFVWHN